ncbi:MAG: hypothetical protein VKK59_05450 [Vampirovibrionales bacterium]|nr:hypothetical protein [Vampirovibrionales bacterium]
MSAPVIQSAFSPPFGSYTRTSASKPYFGSAVSDGVCGLIAHARPVFESIESSYISELLVADMGMWLTRIGTALARGRHTYDVNQDPQAAQLNPLQRRWRQLSRNIKGLDYPNALEETIREVQAGPSLLMVPSVSFALWKTFFGGSEAFSLPVGGFLTPINQKFGEFLAGQLPQASMGPLSPGKQRELLASFVSQNLLDPADYSEKALKTAHTFNQVSLHAVAPHNAPKHQKFLYGQLKNWRNEKQTLEDLTSQVMQEVQSFGKTRSFRVSAKSQALTLPAYITQWSERWAEASLRAVSAKSSGIAQTELNKQAAVSASHELELLTAELKSNLLTFHRRFRPVNAHFLERLDQIKPTISGHLTIDKMMQRLSKWRSFAAEILHQPNLNAATVTQEITALQKGLLKKKLNWIIVAGVLNAIWLASISVMAQSGKSYPANRAAIRPTTPPSGDMYKPSLPAKSMPGNFSNATPFPLASAPLAPVLALPVTASPQAGGRLA